MPWTDLFVRDSLQDTGITPSPGYPYTSPDLICTQQNTYQNPTQVFSANYGLDPNLPAKGNQNNYFYTRAKNLGTQTQGGTMYVYWSTPDLLMYPSRWIQNPMYILVNNQRQFYSPIPAVAANQISVTQVPFIWPAPTVAHYCLVGICATSQHGWDPTNPPSFNTVDEFVMWVRNNQNICWRNLQMVTDPNIPEWDATASFENPWNTTPPLLISAKCEKVPVNTSVTLKCTALNINSTQTVTDPNMTLFAPAVTCPENFSGYIETTAQTPNGTRWPDGATIITTPYMGSTGSSQVVKFAADFGALNEHPHVLKAKSLLRSANGVLLATGHNAIAYKPSA
jgi:hypothetical protein